MPNEYTLGGPPPQSRSEKILMKQNPGPAQSRIEELLKNASGHTSGALIYKGTVETTMSLPSSGNEVGDVYHVNSDGSEWAWNGSTWEELGSAVDLSGYATEQWVEDKGYLTQHQSLAAYRTSAAQDTIDAAQDTAIAAKYTKPSTGIPKTDLASDVKASLGKADTALQEHQSLASYRTASAQDAIDNAQNVEIGKKANSTDLAAVATSGSYNDLADKPSIPSLAGYATQTWVNSKGYLTLADLPVYNGGVS